MCAWWTMADIDRGLENAVCLVQRQDSQSFAFVLPFGRRGGGGVGGRASQDRTAYDAESAGVMRPHLIAIYKQLLWFRNAVKEKQLKQEALV